MQPRLRDVAVHPRAALLVVAREVVGDEQRERLAVGIDDLEHAHVRLVHRQILALLEGEAVELVRGVEHAVLHHAVELEVRRHLRLVEVVVGLAHLLGVERPVPGLQLEGWRTARRGLRIDELLDVRGLLARAR